MINCNNCEELNALKQDYKACEEEYKRLAGQYKALLKQNEELQATINRTCKDCNSDTRFQQAINEFEIIMNLTE